MMRVPLRMLRVAKAPRPWIADSRISRYGFGSSFHGYRAWMPRLAADRFADARFVRAVASDFVPGRFAAREFFELLDCVDVFAFFEFFELFERVLRCVVFGGMRIVRG